MNLQTAFAALLWTVPVLTAAFVNPATLTTTRVAATTTCLQASRRDCLAWAVTTTGTVWGLGIPNAHADLDFDRVQDLLNAAPLSQYQAAPVTKRPTYLTEPTDEFIENERKASEFKREQLVVKAQFLKALTKLQEDPNDEELLAGDLDELRRLVRAEGGLPLGITRDEVVKQVRRRKSKKYWPVNCEIAYVLSCLFFSPLLFMFRYMIQ